MSNFKKKMKFFLKIADNPREFYEYLDYHQERLFQKLIFPEGFKFSMKYKDCRTQKMNLLFELSSSFANKYNECKKETQAKKLLESHLVERTEKISNQLLIELDNFNEIFKTLKLNK